MANTFHLNGLPMVRHTKETREIFSEIKGNKSEFQRNKILEFTKQYGFSWQSNNGNIPDFVPKGKWQEYQRLSKYSTTIDYTYIIAYYWLRSLDKFQFAKHADLQRLIISN
jgi:hypothetical protein